MVRSGLFVNLGFFVSNCLEKVGFFIKGFRIVIESRVCYCFYYCIEEEIEVLGGWWREGGGVG